MTPSILGRYRIEAELGSGRYCETFQAFDLVHRRSVALKLLRQELFNTPEDWHSFLQEIQNAADLIHPHIAWIWETDEQDGRQYLVERFIGGETLKSLITRSGPLPADQAIKALEEIAQAIEFGQQHGWTHGAVTPRNIIISHDLGAVLSDYGLMTAVRRRFGRTAPDLDDAVYLPPEVLHGAPLTPAADIYALACCLLESLSGSNPFRAPTLSEIIEKKTTAFQIQQLPLVTVPLQANHVIERALNPDPSRRFKYALDFIDTFEKNVRHGLTDASGRAEHEEQLRIWRETQEKERILAEEASRREAVEKARQEIHERARQEAEQVLRQNEQPDYLVRPPIESDSTHTVPASKAKKNWLVQLLIGIILFAAIISAAYWLKSRDLQSGGSLASATATGQADGSFELLRTETAPVVISTFTVTATERSSPTLIPSYTRTPQPSPTFSLTPSRTAPPPTSTPERSDNNTRQD